MLIAISFTFLSSVSSNKLGFPAFLKVGLATLHLAFQEFSIVLLKLYLAYLDENVLITDAGGHSKSTFVEEANKNEQEEGAS